MYFLILNLGCVIIADSSSEKEEDDTDQDMERQMGDVGGEENDVLDEKFWEGDRDDPPEPQVISCQGR